MDQDSRKRLRDLCELRRGETYKTSIKDKAEAFECREKLGLRKIKEGETTCLKCGKPFFSQDLANIRQCDYCKYNLPTRHRYKD